MKLRILRKILVSTFGLITAFGAQTAQADCYCLQGAVHGRYQCVAPIGPNNSMVVLNNVPICSSNSYNPPPPLVKNVYDILVLSWTNNSKTQTHWYRREYKTTSNVDSYIYNETAQMALDACNSDSKARPCKHATWVVGDACIAYMDTPKIMYSDRGNTCHEASDKVLNRRLAYYKGNKKICSGVQYKQPRDIPFS